MMGPGKYDHLCTYVRDAAQAQGVVVIVIGGEHGHGFSCQADPLTTLTLPDLLEKVAKDIRADMENHDGRQPDHDQPR